MAKRNILSRIRLRYRKSSTLTKAVVLSAIVLSLATLLTIGLTKDALLERFERARQQAARQEYENSQLEDKIDGLGSADSVGDIAEDELGMVDPTEGHLKPKQ